MVTSPSSNGARLTNQWKTVFVVYLLASTARLSFVLLYPGHSYYPGISRGYEELAVNYVNGRGFTQLLDVSPRDSSEQQFVYVPYLARPIGYAIFLTAVFSVFGHHLVIAQVVQALLTSLVAVFVYLISKRIFSGRTALLAGILSGVWPVTSRFEIALLPDALVGILLLTATYSLLRTEDARSYLWSVVCGLAIGASILMKPNGALLALFFVGFLLVAARDRGRFCRALLILATTSVLLVPNVVRNFQLTGRFVPFGLGLGISLWEGLSDFGERYGTTLDDQELARREGYRQWSYPYPVEREAQRTAYALNVIKEHPLWYAGMMVWRIPLIFTIHPSLFVEPSPSDFRRWHPDKSLMDYCWEYPVHATIVAAVAAISYALVVVSILAIWYERHRWRRSWIPMIVPVCFVLLHIPQHTESRYFYPAIPHLVILAVATISHFHRKATTESS